MLVPDGGGGSGPVTSVAGVPLTGLAAIGQILSGALEIAIDAAQVDQVNQHLDAAKQHLEDAKATLVAVPLSGVGGSPVGHDLAHHSGLAHEALTSTLSNMEGGLVYYRQSIKAAVDKLTDTDEVAGAAARQGEGCIAPTPSSTPSTTCGGA